MKNGLVAFSLLCTLVASGCMTLHPTTASTDELRRSILAGELLKTGDNVRLVTADQQVHKFRIDAIDADAGVVSGAGDSVRVADIVGVATRDFAVGKTVGLVLGIIGALQLSRDVADVATLGP
jgi:hypothetical protein